MTPDEFADRFSRLHSWDDRYRYLIQLGRKLEPYPEEFRDQEHLVPGCLSQVWLVTDADSEPSQIAFRADSDAHIVIGLIAVLLMMYADKTAGIAAEPTSGVNYQQRKVRAGLVRLCRARRRLYSRGKPT